MKKGRGDTFSLSGIECAAALEELGFELVEQSARHSILRRRQHVVVVPTVLMLPQTVIDVILERADVSYEALLRAVEEVPTDPELPTLDAE